MRSYFAPSTKLTIIVGLAIALLLPAAAGGQHTPKRDRGPLRVWSFSEATAAGLEFRQLDGAPQQGGRLNKLHNFGTTLFNPSRETNVPASLTAASSRAVRARHSASPPRRRSAT